MGSTGERVAHFGDAEVGHNMGGVREAAAEGGTS